MTTPDWSVLLIAGASGTGKTTVAKAISRDLGVAWVQVDDLRLDLQFSDARLPTGVATDDLHFFLGTPELWTLPAETLVDALVATGEAMTEATAIVTGNHIVQGDPAMIEGDGILPGLLDHLELRGFVFSGALRMVVLAQENESELLEAMVERGRGEHFDPGTPESGRIAAMNWRFTRWLAAEAGTRGIPVVPTRPLKTLAARLLENLRGSRQWQPLLRECSRNAFALRIQPGTRTSHGCWDYSASTSCACGAHTPKLPLRTLGVLRSLSQDRCAAAPLTLRCAVARPIKRMWRN